MKTPLFPPSRCTSSLPDDLTKDYLVAEEKLDGSRYVLYLGCDPYERQKGNTLLSRRVSVVDAKHVDRTNNVPHITGPTYESLDGTVIDGEIRAADFTSTNSIMNSSSALAVSKQKEMGLMSYYVWDVMSFRGKDVRGLALSDRRKILEYVLIKMNNPNIIPLVQVTKDLNDFFLEIVNKGGEGIIVKDLRQGYGNGWCKYKKSYDVSCVISGWKPGKPGSKYEKQIGSLALSVFKDGRLIEVGFASGFDDSLRAKMTKNFEEYRNRVVDVFAQEIQKSENPRLRHPTFHRLRDDMNAEDCTLEKLLADLKKKVKSSRRKDE